MNAIAEKKVETRIRDILDARTRELQGIPRVLVLTDWREDAITRFFHDYVVESDVVPHTTTALKTLYRNVNTSSCLKDAVSAASFASQANQLHLPFMATKANKLYGRALRSLTKALEDPVESLEDAILATPYLLGWYEVRCPLL